MALRLYISPISGDGQSPETAYRAQIRDEPGVPQCATLIPSDGAGLPRFSWCLCVVDADPATHDTLALTYTRFPVFPLSALIGDIPAVQRQAIQARMTNLGISTAGLALTDPLRKLVLRVARFLEPTVPDGDYDAVNQ